MRISTIALANLRRRKAQAVFLATGIALGVGSVVAMLGLGSSIRHEIGTQLDRFGANITVTPKSDSLSLSYGGIAIPGVAIDNRPLTVEDAASIFAIPYRSRLSAVAPKLFGTLEVQGQPLVLAGVDFENELKVRPWWRVIGRVPRGPAEILLGSEAASALGLSEPNQPRASQTDPVHGHDHGSPESTAISNPGLASTAIMFAGYEHTVVGLLAETGGAEDRMVFVQLDRAQELLDRPGEISLIEISALCRDCPVEHIVEQIAEQVPDAEVSAVQQAVHAREATVERLGRFGTAVSLLILSIGGLFVFTTTSGSLVERTREIGLLRAVGFRKTHITVQLLVEIGAVSVIGGLMGWLLGTLGGWAALPYFAEAESSFEARLTLIPISVIAAAALGVLSSLYPIVRASRLDPAEAVRSV